MPSIAQFIKDLLAEEKYSGDFSNRIQERIETLNAAQLQGLYHHLTNSANNSKTKLWKSANEEIVLKIKDTLRARLKEEEIERKIIEEYKLKQRQKKQAIIAAENERQRVMEMIEERARKQAEEEVKKQEYQRQVDEKLVILKRVFEQEERRNKWFRNTAIIFIISVVVPSVILKNIIYIIAIVGVL
jgi:hypothetical protein